MNDKKETIKPCPFCGKEVDQADPDTIYPSGIGWIEQESDMITYHSFRDVPKEQWCWSIHCAVTSGGCGAEMSGDSKQECIDKWNTRNFNQIFLNNSLLN